MTNILKKIIFYLIIISAILGFLLIYLSFGGRRFYRYGSRNEYSIYTLLIGGIMILPLFGYYLIRGKIYDNNKEDNLKTYLPLNKRKENNLNIKKTKENFLVYIYNDTKNKVSVKEIIIEPKKSYTFQVRNDEIIKLSNGVQFYIEEMENLTVIDKKSQLSGIGQENLEKYFISKNVDFAFFIKIPFLGDLNYEIEGYD